MVETHGKGIAGDIIPIVGDVTDKEGVEYGVARQLSVDSDEDG